MVLAPSLPGLEMRRKKQTTVFYTKNFSIQNTEHSFAKEKFRFFMRMCMYAEVKVLFVFTAKNRAFSR